ncbi:MAG: hypothetical protein AAFW00_19090 [Bacteroidota bacterium]
MSKTALYFLGWLMLVLTACSSFNDRPRGEVTIPDFNFPQTLVFEQNLSSYQLFEGTPADLTPAEDVHLLELSSVLFTDYAHKQRLVKLPEGRQMTRQSEGSIDFPDGTILTKTFYYYNDERDRDLGKRIIETRLLIKENATWNIATYLWNEAQTEATLTLDGVDTQVSWTSSEGNNLSTLYHVPTQNECMVCHQSYERMSPLGPTLRNLNRSVERNGMPLNQIAHLQAVSVMNDFAVDQVPKMPDYKDTGAPLSERGRAYFAMNCAHCHNPGAWEASAERDFDFRYETPFDQTGILFERDRIEEALRDQEMPFIGTTLLDQEGVDLVIAYMESL